MSPSKFRIISRKYFGSYLSEFGFSSEKSNIPIYFRKNKNDVYHFIAPQLNSNGTWFDIDVFTHSPLIEDWFFDRFPDNLDIPSGSFKFLHPKTGVGFDQKLYRCRTEEGFIRNFTQQSKPALEKFGIPYLDKIQTIDDVIATIPDHMRHLYKISS